jgi:transposase
MMKLQDVLLKVMAKKISWADAGEIIGVSCRTMRRWRERLEEGGYSGLADRRKGKPSAQRVPLATVEQVLVLYQETYYNLNIRHFHEKLREQHDIQLSYTWVQQALQGAGLVARGKKRGQHRRRRERRPLPGMLLHLDGSKHPWLDAAGLARPDRDSGRCHQPGLLRATGGGRIDAHGDGGLARGHRNTPRAGGKVDQYRPTQVGRALKELGVQMIPAYSRQARGRSERSFGTWQGRLPQELRLADVQTVEQANRFLQERYVAEFNAKFTVAASQKGTAFRAHQPYRSGLDLTVQSERVVAKDNTVTIAERSWQLDRSRFRSTLAGMTVTIHEHLDGKVSIRWGPHTVGRFDAAGRPLHLAVKKERAA